MPNLEFDIDKAKSPRDILKALRRNKISKGDSVKLLTTPDTNNFVIIVVLIFILIEIFHKKMKNHQEEKFADEVLNKLFDKDYTTDELEKQIKQHGVKVEVKKKEYNRKDDERKYWLKLSKSGLSEAYSNNEPEYSLKDIKEHNPDYKAWKKGK